MNLGSIFMGIKETLDEENVMDSSKLFFICNPIVKIPKVQPAAEIVEKKKQRPTVKFGF